MVRKRKKFPWVSVLVLGVLLVALAASVFYFNRTEIFRLLTEATGTEADLVVRADSDLGPIRRIWAHLAQGGEDLTVNMLSPVQGKVAALGPETIRLDHIYDGYDVVSRDDTGSLLFNWTRLDGVVASIRSTGARPMLSLSYMPSVMGNGDITGVPVSWNEWSLLVQRTIEHYSGTLKIPGVIYEVWNEPDLFGGWKTYGEKNYLQLYLASAQGASRARVGQSFELGGPATTAVYPAWIAGFLAFVDENNLRLDYVSWHRYGFDREAYAQEIALVQKEAAKYFRFASGLPIYLTESGPKSDNSASNDSWYGAAHLVSLIRNSYDGVDKVYTFEIVDGKDPAGQAYWGRWGILTHPDFGATPKPRYMALQALNKLLGQRLTVSGEGTWVQALATKKEDGALALVVVNYDPYGRHIESPRLTVQALEQGNYLVSKRLVGGGEVTEEVRVLSNRILQTQLSLPASSILQIEIKRIGD